MSGDSAFCHGGDSAFCHGGVGLATASALSVSPSLTSGRSLGESFGWGDVGCEVSFERSDASALFKDMRGTQSQCGLGMLPVLTPIHAIFKSPEKYGV